MTLDPRTLLLIGGMLCWALAAWVGSNSIHKWRDAWLLGLVMKGAGLNLIGLRGQIDDVWSVALANALLLMGPLLFYVALQRVRGAVTRHFLIAMGPVGLAIALPIVGFSETAFVTRVFVIMAAWLFVFSLSTWSSIQIFKAGYRTGAAMIMGANGIMALFAISFALAVASYDVVGIFNGSPIQSAFYMANIFCSALGTVGYVAIKKIARGQRQHLELSSC
jgi:hypothetical protein